MATKHARASRGEGSPGEPSTKTKHRGIGVMPIQKMPICGVYSFSDYFNIDKGRFAKTGAFDLLLNRDTTLMIDPKLLNDSHAKELASCYDLVLDRFRKIFKALEQCKVEGDLFWKAAYRLTDFREFRGVSLGYAQNSNDGAGWAGTLRTQVLRSARQIITIGIQDPEFFELLALFEPQIGPDRISDMIGTILLEPLTAFTKNACAELDIAMEFFPIHGKNFELPWYLDEDGVKRYIILVPEDVLSDLPVALDRSDIADVMETNEGLRQHLNLTIQGDWQQVVVSREGKQITRESFFDNPDTFRAFIERYRDAVGTPYDIEGDPEAVKLWYDMARRSIEDNAIKLELPTSPSFDDLFAIVDKIVQHFKQLIENNRLREALFIGDKPRREKVVQFVFYAIARTHCDYNNLDISPETDAGRGPVDFKLSRGAAFRVLVEIKLSNSTKLLHGYRTQLEEYKRAENTDRAIYLVLDVGGHDHAMAKLRALHAESPPEKRPTLVVVDGRPKPSASKTTEAIFDAR